MDNYNGFQPTYQPVTQPNMYYQSVQPTTAVPMYQPRNWQQVYQPQNTNMNYQAQVPQINNSMVWVQGEAGAKAYTIPNNTTIPLWDSETQTIYIKTVDQNGKPSMTILDYVERNSTNQNIVDNKQVVQIEYATKEQIDELNGQFDSMNKKLDSMGQYVTKDQFKDLTSHINDLSGQIEDIEDRITSFGKPQSNNSTNNRRGNK